MGGFHPTFKLSATSFEAAGLCDMVGASVHEAQWAALETQGSLLKMVNCFLSMFWVPFGLIYSFMSPYSMHMCSVPMVSWNGSLRMQRFGIKHSVLIKLIDQLIN